MVSLFRLINLFCRIYIKRLVLTFGGIFMTSFQSEKDNLIKEFFDVGGHHDINFRVNAIKKIKLKLIELLKTQDDNDMEVQSLIDVINALLFWILEDDKVKARKEVNHIWEMFNNKNEFTFFEIRILTTILFSAKSLKEFIIVTNKALHQLEAFSEHHFYIHVKAILNNNLSYILIKAKYLQDKEYNSELDKLLLDTTNNVLDISMKYETPMFPMALIRMGILLKDKSLIYAGLVILNIPDAREKVASIENYGTFFIQYKNLM